MIRAIPFMGVVATALLLAACGGGSSNGTGSTTNPEIPEEITEEATKAAKSAAESDPVYGSVSQTSVSTDAAADVNRDRDSGVYLITLPSSDDTTISLNTDDHVQPGTEGVDIISGLEVNYMNLKKESGGSITHAGIFESEIEEFGNWFVGGFWLHGSNVNSEQPSFEFGAFMDGPEISGDPTLPTGGSANYSGEAGGLYSVSEGTDLTDSIGSYNGDFEATANFRSGGGTLSGKVTITDSSAIINVINDLKFTGTNSQLVGIEFKWDNVQFDSNGQATGDVTVNLDNAEGFPDVELAGVSGGKTGNRFSSETVSESNLNPRMLVGTHGATISTVGGAEAAFIGIHFGGFSEN